MQTFVLVKMTAKSFISFPDSILRGMILNPSSITRPTEANMLTGTVRRTSCSLKQSIQTDPLYYIELGYFLRFSLQKILSQKFFVYFFSKHPHELWLNWRSSSRRLAKMKEVKNISVSNWWNQFSRKWNNYLILVFRSDLDPITSYF